MNGTYISVHMKSFLRAWEWFIGGGYVSLIPVLSNLSLTDTLLQIHGQCYPTWRSLAHDYLAIMASSVESESTFSAAGITISKRHNWLEGNIVEALQCLKSFIHQDLIFHEVISATQDEVDLDLADQDPTNHEGNATEIVQDAEDISKNAKKFGCLKNSKLFK